MTKTYPWSTIVPAGSEQASTADDHIRRLRLEIEERMSDIVEDWSADPVELKLGFGALTDQKIMIHGGAFIIEPDSDNVDYNDDGISVTDLTEQIRTPLILPVGYTITRLRWLVTNNTAEPLTLQLGSIGFALGVDAQIVSSVSTSTSGTQIVDTETLGAFTHTVGERILYLGADKASTTGSSGFRLHGVEVTYNTPGFGE
jgi:hypothetical protein